jgi:hypothetical protein
MNTDNTKITDLHEFTSRSKQKNWDKIHFRILPQLAH